MTYSQALSPGTYIGFGVGLADAVHYADDSYIPIDQMNVMENSQPLIGVTQNLLPEEANF